MCYNGVNVRDNPENGATGLSVSQRRKGDDTGSSSCSSIIRISGSPVRAATADTNSGAAHLTRSALISRCPRHRRRKAATAVWLFRDAAPQPQNSGVHGGSEEERGMRPRKGAYRRRRLSLRSVSRSGAATIRKPRLRQRLPVCA